ncbi:hypothetical protein [Pinirhizobacter soli]|uniref:hypothetical protein n=1 Tax=Pinirhizobacter soli TaxID=2786953 RepID=UPI00202A9D9E|nr:hypothetical protein [Pinirhizobacter soli]
MIGSVQVDAFLRALVKFGQDEGITIRAMVWFVGDPRMYRQDIPLDLSLLGPDGMGDPGLGSGPVRYEDIETIVLSCETNTKAMAFPSGSPRCQEAMAALASRLPADKSIEVQDDRITWRRSPAGESIAERAPTKYAHVVRVDAKSCRVIISRIDDEMNEFPLTSFDMPGPVEDASRAANIWHQAFFALAHGIGETILFDSPEAKQLYGDSL